MPEADAHSETEFPISAAILHELGKQMPFMLKAAQRGGETPLAQRLSELEFIGERLRRMAGNDPGWIARAVKSYVVLSLEFLKLQRKLEETGRYLFSTERETLANVYSSEGVFGDYYLEGLLLSEALWPNHHKFGKSFREEFVPLLPSNGRVLEAGVGSGYHLAQLLNARSDLRYLGIDISTYAIDFARRFVSTSDGVGNVCFRHADITKGIDAEPFDAIICGEVLEHVEDPGRLLTEMKRVMRTGGCAFITTVAFAASIDHIYLFEDAQQIRDLIASCGWRVSKEWALPVYPGDSPEAKRRPLNYGAVLTAE